MVVLGGHKQFGKSTARLVILDTLAIKTIPKCEPYRSNVSTNSSPDALELAPDCLDYMSKLQCIEVFRFCAIPQVMAIATLDKLYGNPLVFTGVVKIRKGMSCKLILQTNNIPELHAIFHAFAVSIANKAVAQKRAGLVDP
jgi:hypothetical protein